MFSQTQLSFQKMFPEVSDYKKLKMLKKECYDTRIVYYDDLSDTRYVYLVYCLQWIRITPEQKRDFLIS